MDYGKRPLVFSFWDNVVMDNSTVSGTVFMFCYTRQLVRYMDAFTVCDTILVVYDPIILQS